MAKTITLTGTDVDGDSLTFIVTGLPTNGQLYDGTGTAGHHITLGDLPYTVTDPAGNVTYDPNADFNGIDSFIFKANDGTVDSDDAAVVTITVAAVNDAPVATNDSYGTNEDTTLNVARPGRPRPTTATSTATTLTAVLVTGPSHGSLTLNSDGTFSYSPAADYNGLDSFTYKANDGDRSTANVASVTVTVNSVNDAPAGDRHDDHRRRGRQPHLQRRRLRLQRQP